MLTTVTSFTTVQYNILRPTTTAFLPITTTTSPTSLGATPSSMKHLCSIAALAFVLTGNPQQVEAATSNAAAAQISLDSIPPKSIRLDLTNIPVVGNFVSGTYKIVQESPTETPDITIAGPKDWIQAAKGVATRGHVETDVTGLLNTHLEVDIAATNAGTATVKVSSDLVPKLPFQNSASVDGGVLPTGKQTYWYKVVNMGTGDYYYYNEQSQVAQLEAPEKL